MSYQLYLKQKAQTLLVALILSAATPGYSQIPFIDEYQEIGYTRNATRNPVAQLISALEKGEIQLSYTKEHGYLESLLDALHINPASQALVFSKTSLQHLLISTQTPRAIYFNDSTYIGWVQGSKLIEVMTIDDQLGLVFYVIHNEPQAPQLVERVNQGCLVCHDSNGTMGGGTPLLLARSSIYSIRDAHLLDILGDENASDSTPIAKRWGGWYVTGQSGNQKHLGNVQLRHKDDLPALDEFRAGNIDSLAQLNLFDSTPYLRDTSDIVALMVLEHQLSVQNQITYVKFKAPVVLGRIGFKEAQEAKNWAGIPAKAQTALSRMLDKLVALLLENGATTFSDSISGNENFTQYFQAQGPRDSQNRSLRDLDLHSQLFRYPLSYLFYSSSFDTLPAYAKDYVQHTIIKSLQQQADSKLSASEQKRSQDTLSIILETKPDLRRYLNTN